MLLAEYNKMLPIDALNQFAEQNSESYKTAHPFAHSVVDGMFDQQVLDAVIEEFYQTQEGWNEFKNKYEGKLQMTKDAFMQPVTRAFIHNLNSEPFLEFLEKLTGIDCLIPDPYLIGGGLHKIGRGGKLGIHVDFNFHPRLQAYRRLNVIIYLNKNWEESYGGHFELWDEKKEGCQKKLLPIYNRMAIFSTTSTSFHGHPEPLTCPEDRERISLALYYYTAGNPGEQASKEHSTVFLNEKGKRDIKFNTPPTRFQKAMNKIFGSKAPS